MPTQITPGAVKRSLLDLSHGLATSPPAEQESLIVGGELMLVADLVDELDGYTAFYQAVEDAEEQYKIALAARRALEAQARARRKAIRAAIKGTMGARNPALRDFGMTPDKERQPLTAAKLTEMVARGKATRAARHTMGKKQKLAIKGELPPPPAKKA